MGGEKKQLLSTLQYYVHTFRQHVISYIRFFVNAELLV